MDSRWVVVARLCWLTSIESPPLAARLEVVNPSHAFYNNKPQHPHISSLLPLLFLLVEFAVEVVETLAGQILLSSEAALWCDYFSTFTIGIHMQAFLNINESVTTYCFAVKRIVRYRKWR
jgi:hypothetical protein